MNVNGNFKHRLFRVPIFHGTFAASVIKGLILFGKCLVVMFLPLVIAWPVAYYIWLPYFYRQGKFIPTEFEVSYTAAVIPILGIFYVIIATVFLATVWREYKNMRMAVKVGDEYTFQLYRKENVSPLIHTLIFVLSMFLLRSFMNLHYPTTKMGLEVVGGLTYMLILYFLVLIEIDNPCSGLWFIADIPQSWLKRDCEAYLRQMREENIRKQRFPTCSIEIEVEA